MHFSESAVHCVRNTSRPPVLRIDKFWAYKFYSKSGEVPATAEKASLLYLFCLLPGEREASSHGF